ncbi:hypothetical protein DFH07DRAFT_1002530 [Mycena maculata]|uniref:ABC transmembrane type-1 domain-containing protein n=1 Tax=Mycena maculata TaxID=230809 RepID=A0AAD7HQ21_9AGAR|nr:hypothetical protein DFH07DRAFT_1002530 [Mycena maculata]
MARPRVGEDPNHRTNRDKLLCGDSGPFDVGNACVRGSWAAMGPSILVFAICLSFLPPPPLPTAVRKVVDAIKSPFKPYLSLHDAEGLVLADEKRTSEEEVALEVKNTVPLWRTLVFVFVGLVECLAWLADGSFLLITGHPRWEAIQRFLVASTWLYATARPIFRPTATPPYDMFTIYMAHIAGGILQLGGVPVPAQCFRRASARYPGVALVGLVAVIMGMPLALPSHLVNKADIGGSVSPENYTSLWGWVTFTWVYPLVKKGRNTTLNEDDVWALSPNIQSRPIFIKFSTLPQKSLLAKLWAANSFDIIESCIVALRGFGPYRLNHRRILNAIDTDAESENEKGKAYIYAVLMFTCSVCKVCAVPNNSVPPSLTRPPVARSPRLNRVLSELMAAIYDKALKRKDFSAVIDKEKAKDAADKKAAATARTSPVLSKTDAKTKAKADKDSVAKADDPKPGAADTGKSAKIVNLMSGDASRVAGLIDSLYSLYGAPVQIIIGSVFLYQLLGLSAFAGFVFLILSWPLNSYFSRRGIRIYQGVLKANDVRMGVLNELISAVKFVKFFAWEQRWIDRALNARNEEIKRLVKSHINDIGFQMYFIYLSYCGLFGSTGDSLWISGPVFISVISFFTYVMLGHELTISKAFTTRICLNRIAVYLDEAEVTDQVSSLKKDRSASVSFESEDDRLGFENVSFKWNKVREAPDAKDNKDNKANATSEMDFILTADSDGTATADHKFELKGLSVIFPEGELTVVTGPTASGKTALLMSFLYLNICAHRKNKMAVLGEMTTLPGGRIIMSKNPSKIDAHGNMQTISTTFSLGNPLEEARYQQVIECCALQADLDQLEGGDGTEIEEKGVSLSGGQKASMLFSILIQVSGFNQDSTYSPFVSELCLLAPSTPKRSMSFWTIP